MSLNSALGAAPPSLRRARWACRTQFALLGMGAATWGVHIPNAKALYGLDAAGLSGVLLAAAVGAVLCLGVAGRLVARLGPQRACQAAGLTMCAALSGVLLGGPVAVIVALMVVFGGAGAIFDVAINAEGTVLEEASGRKVMSGFHGMFSVGGMLGAGLGAALIAAAVPPAVQVPAIAVLMAATVALASLGMLRQHPAHPPPPSGWQFPRGTLLVLGVLGALGLMAEGAMYDWGVLFLQRETLAEPSVAALGYASFSAAMAATRFAGDPLRSRISAPRLLAASSLLAAAAMAAVLVVREPVFTLVGFALVGAGMANVVPILFIAATRVPGVSPPAAIAGVSSLGYMGFVAGPPLVGGVAQVSSLSVGLGMVVLASLCLAWGARALPR